MPSISSIIYYAWHPQQLRNIIQWTVHHVPVHERDVEKEEPSLRKCFEFLDMTSRSFSAVIKELDHELLVPVCLFYLVLRGLDTIEDDMTIPLQTKEPLLRNFHHKLDQDGWTFDGSGPNEKDRELLVQFHYVITEFKKIKTTYQEIIRDITKRMGDGMADYAKKAEQDTNVVDTIKDYERYCHIAAGLVGEGLTRLFVESGLANPALLNRPDLHESMGQFLQQTNIIRDIREDLDDKRRFWPKEIWSKYVTDFEDLFKKENRDLALRCSSEMILLALNRADDCLLYLAGIREQSVFNFAAIPQSMAIATLHLCFRNPDVFERNIKITKGDACRLMINSSQNLQILYHTFRQYARMIHKKNDPRDPNFLKISIACGKIEQFIESVFPSQDPRSIVAGVGADKMADSSEPALTEAEKAKRAKEASEAKWDMIYLSLAIGTVVIVVSGLMVFAAYLAGARFDLMWKDFKSSGYGKADSSKSEIRSRAREHREL